MAEKTESAGWEKQLEFVVDWVKVGKKQKKGHFCGKIDTILVPCLVFLCASQGSGKARILSWNTWVDLILQAGG